MPPKKKRGGQNQVTFVVSKMSTRSGKKAIKTTEKPKVTLPKVPVMPKPAVKKGKAAPKTKARKPAAKKKKNEVKSTEFETLDNSVESESDKTNDEELATTAPIEQVFLTMDNDFMETTEIGEAPETSEITQQLENLNVEEPQKPEPVESVEIHDTSEENVVEEVVEIDGCEEFVEYITEEFVPVAENTEIVIVEDEKPEEIIPETKPEETEDIKPEETKVEEAVTLIETKSEEETIVEEKLEQLNTETKLEDPSIEDVKEETQAMEVTEGASQNETEKPQSKPSKKKAAKPKEPKKNPPKKKPAKPKPPKKEPIDKTEEVRRSSRIKSINVLKQRSKGHGLVKQAKTLSEPESESSTPPSTESDKPSDPQSAPPSELDNKPVKVKSRWRRSSELEMNVLTPAAVVIETCGDSEKIAEANNLENKPKNETNPDEEVKTRLKQFVHLKENLYLTDRMTCKEAKKMTCDCFLTSEEIEKGEFGCGEDCLNRLLMIEW